MKKGEIWAIFLLAVVVLGLVLIYSPEEVADFAPSDYFPSLPSDCSGIQIRMAWGGVFDGNFVSSDDLIVIGGVVEGGVCSDYLAYKNTSDELFVLTGSYDRSLIDETFIGPFLNHSTYLGEFIVGAYYSKYDQDFDDLIGNLTQESDVNDFLNILAEFTNSSNLEPRSIVDSDGAKMAFEEVYDYTVEASWMTGSDPDIGATYYFEESEIIPDEAYLEVVGVVFDSYVFTTGDYLREIYEIIPCEPNWTTYETSCDESTETVTTYPIDEALCYEPTDIPSNETEDCDFDGNGLIGTEDDIDDIHFDLELEIDGDEVDYFENFTGEEDIDIIDDDGDIVRVEFEWDFDDGPLNLREIEIEIQDSDDDFGYIIVKGIDAEKKVRVDKVLNSEMICVKDRESVDDIGDIDDECDGSSEYYIECPGEDDNNRFECALSSQDVYVVDGLDHSGVRELDGTPPPPPPPPPPGCTPQWSYGTWSTCVNGEKVRTVVDLNSCENSTTETDVCTVACVPDWDCSGWDPSDSDCSDGETQERTCPDLNSCGTTTGRPTQSKTCEQDGSGFTKQTWIIIIIVVLVLLIIVVIIIIVKVSGSKKKGYRKPTESRPSQVRIIQRQPRGQFRRTHYRR